MSRNGSGTYTLPAGNPVVTGTTIASTWANTTLSDIASALTDSVAADGQTTMTGQLDLGNNKIINLADATSNTDATTLGQVTTQIAAAVSTITGRIVQLISSTFTSSYSVNSSTFSATGHIASITPTSTSSKILVLVLGGDNFNNNTNTGINNRATIYRNSTNLSGSSTIGLQNQSLGAELGFDWANSMIVLDSPASTSSLSYQVYIQGNFSYLGNTYAKPTMLLMEIL
jgi:hypothetical protein